MDGIKCVEISALAFSINTSRSVIGPYQLFLLRHLYIHKYCAMYTLNRVRTVGHLSPFISCRSMASARAPKGAAYRPFSVSPLLYLQVRVVTSKQNTSRSFTYANIEKDHISASLYVLRIAKGFLQKRRNQSSNNHYRLAYSRACSQESTTKTK